MNRLQAAADEMSQRMIHAGHELHGASLLMQDYPNAWPAEIEANWQRMSRRWDRRHRAWARLAAAANREHLTV